MAAPAPAAMVAAAQAATAGDLTLTGIVGHPVAHSLSPAMHNAAFAALGMPWTYAAFDVMPQDLAAVIEGARGLGIRGLNVTAPHKAAAAEAVDRLAGAAAEIRLVNTIVFDEGGAATGHSTDGEGFLAAAHDEGCKVGRGMRAVVVGAGGAGVSVAHALLGRGVRVVLTNRDPARLAAALARLPAAGGVPLGDSRFTRELMSADLVVMAIPPASRVPAGLDLEVLRPGAQIADLVYERAETPVVAAARARGLEAWNGLGMLVHQGALSFALWTGREAPRAVMARAVGYTHLSG
jgi:shikimate dehydrogenase